MRLMVLLAALSIASIPAAGDAQTLSGTVFVDTNGNGSHDPAERGIAGVTVSDQDAVALTDANGEYRLDASPGSGARLIFVSVPDGYRAVGDFWRPAADRLAFALAPIPLRTSFSFVHASDTHVSADSVERTRRLRTMAAALKPAFVIITGDLVKDALRVAESEARGYYDLFAAERQAFEPPVFTVPGNHEYFGIETRSSRVDPAHPLFGGEMYREFFGPEYYSFTHGGVHFVGLDTVDVDADRYYGHVDARQLGWLQRDIAAIPADMPVVTFNHIPFYTTGALVSGYTESGAGATLITVGGTTQFRHSVANAAEVLGVLGPNRRVLALGGHVHFAESIERPGDNVRFATTAATVGPSGEFPSGFTVYTVRRGEIDAGRFVPLD
jgi:hypothetical protein